MFRRFRNWIFKIVKAEVILCSVSYENKANNTRATLTIDHKGLNIFKNLKLLHPVVKVPDKNDVVQPIIAVLKSAHNRN